MCDCLSSARTATVHDSLTDARALDTRTDPNCRSERPDALRSPPGPSTIAAVALWKKDRKVSAAESLFDASKVDLVAISADGTAVEVIIVNDCPWTGSDAQVMSLQEKVHAYVGFALDGQMVAAYPETEGLAWRIVIADRAGPPDARSADVIARIGEKVREYGGEVLVR